MNCLQFRRNKLAAPRHMPEDALAHALECPSCVDFARSQDQFENQLEVAVRIPVDPTLAQRIVLDRKLKTGRRTRLVAMAASVLLVSALGAGIGYPRLRARYPRAARLGGSCARRTLRVRSATSGE